MRNKFLGLLSLTTLARQSFSIPTTQEFSASIEPVTANVDGVTYLNKVSTRLYYRRTSDTRTLIERFVGPSWIRTNTFQFHGVDW